jgi:hypothetical protein
MDDRLLDWEIETIERLADEHIEQLERKEFVRHPETVRTRFIASVQHDALSKPETRRAIERAANRLGIGFRHPARVADEPPLPIADDTLASRWCRVTLLKLRTPPEHEWSILFADVVTRHVSTHRHTALPWTPADQGLGIIDLLEIEATRHGLIAGDAPSLTAGQVAAALVGAAA